MFIYRLFCVFLLFLSSELPYLHLLKLFVCYMTLSLVVVLVCSYLLFVGSLHVLLFYIIVFYCFSCMMILFFAFDFNFGLKMMTCDCCHFFSSSTIATNIFPCSDHYFFFFLQVLLARYFGFVFKLD